MTTTTTEQQVREASTKIGALGWAFYFVPETLARGKELGLDGFRFYFLGRGGVLGDVEAPVVASAFGYFNPDLVRTMWDSGREKVAPRDAGRAYVQCCQEFGRRRLADVEGLAAFCEAAEAVNAAVDVAGLALYAGAAAEPLADDLPARAMQLVTVLREHRGSVHLLAVLASGLTAKQAHYLRRPDDFASFGWDDGDRPSVTDADRQALATADELTDRLLVSPYSVLDEAGWRALLDGLAGIERALAG